jgi:arylformamidase
MHLPQVPRVFGAEGSTAGLHPPHPLRRREELTMVFRFSAHVATSLVVALVLASSAAAQTARRADLDAVFDRLDRNGDELITPEELPRRNMFERLDADGDGSITRDEVRKVMAEGLRDMRNREYQTPELSEDVRVTRDIAYRKNEGVDPKLLSLDIYRPVSEVHLESTGLLPVVVMIHGGGWSRGDKTGATGAKAQFFPDEGFIYVSINYRLSPAVQHPVHVDDVACALAWIHDHVEDFGGDPDQLIVMGHSAGAHLAALVSTDARRLEAYGKPLSIIDGTILLDGAAYDIARTMDEFDPGPAMVRMYTAAFGEDEPGWRDASPQMHVAPGKDIPRMLIFHTAGRRSAAVLSRALAHSLTEAGSPSTARHARDYDHARINRDIGVPDDWATGHIMAFIREVLDLPPVPESDETADDAPPPGPSGAAVHLLRDTNSRDQPALE